MKRRRQVSADTPSVPVQAGSVRAFAALRARWGVQEQTAGAGGVLARTLARHLLQGHRPAKEAESRTNQ